MIRWNIFIGFEPHNETIDSRKEIDEHVLTRTDILSSLRNAGVTNGAYSEIGLKTHRKKDADAGKDHTCCWKCLKINNQRTGFDHMTISKITRPTPPPIVAEKV